MTAVFDGDTNSDAKRATNEARAEQVQASQAPRRTKEQMFAVMNALRRAEISFLVAALVEADHQLAYLLQTGAVDIVLCGDSDLLLHHGMRLLRVGSTGKAGGTAGGKGGCWRYFVKKRLIATMKRMRRE